MAANPYSERLEYVRREVAHVETVRDFWRALGYDQMDKDDPAYVSYESARLYHKDRTPSIDYLVRVHEVYGVPVNWLLLGEPDESVPMRDPVPQLPPDRQKVVDDAIVMAIPPVTHLPVVRDAIRRAALAHARTSTDPTKWASVEIVIAGEMGKLLRRFVQDPNELYVFQLERFATGIADGIAALAPRAMVHQRYRDVERAGVQVW